MIALGEDTRVYPALGATDMRTSIDALAALVVDVLNQEPCSAQVTCATSLRGCSVIGRWTPDGSHPRH